MMISFAGNCASEKVTIETINTQGGGTMSKCDVQIAVNRGAASKRYDFLQGKEYDCDFYRVTLFGKLAEAFVKYYSKGRPVSISGQLLTNEFITKKENAVIISPTNALYNVIAPYITAPNCRMQDGSVVMAANYVVKQPVVNAQSFNWLTSNPNKEANGTQAALPNFNNMPGAGQAGMMAPGVAQAGTIAPGAGQIPAATPSQAGMPPLPVLPPVAPAVMAPMTTGAPFVPNGEGFGY